MGSHDEGACNSTEEGLDWISVLRVFYHPKAAKELLRVPKKFRNALLKSIEALQQCGYPLQHKDVRLLHGGKHEGFRLKVGDYRIRFLFHKSDHVFITKVRHRQSAYK